MIRDIKIPEVKNVTLAVAREKTVTEKEPWKVYLINNNDFAIENTLVASKGYGEKDGKPQQTTILRHFLETIRSKKRYAYRTYRPGCFSS